MYGFLLGGGNSIQLDPLSRTVVEARVEMCSQPPARYWLNCSVTRSSRQENSLSQERSWSIDIA